MDPSKTSTKDGAIVALSDTPFGRVILAAVRTIDAVDCFSKEACIIRDMMEILIENMEFFESGQKTHLVLSSYSLVLTFEFSKLLEQPDLFFNSLFASGGEL